MSSALLVETYSHYAGRELDFDERVYRSETDTGHRNRGMAHILRSFGVIDNPDEALDLPFRQCSLSVECRDLAVVAERGSKRVRTQAHRDAIQAAATRALVVELPGELSFSASEALARCIEEPPGRPELVVVDLSRVVRADAGGKRFIVSLADRVHERGGRLALTPESGVKGSAIEGLPASVAVFANLDLALEWCEDELLARIGEEPAVTEVPLAAPRAADRAHAG